MEPFKDELMVTIHEDVVDVLPIIINKGKGLLEVMRVLKMTKDKVMTVGDSNNDLLLFRNVGHSIIIGSNPVTYHETKRFNDIDEALDYFKRLFSVSNR
jgi:hydroxymethylpyrimidine pyrophosphatase-like HAD family hydrolase